MSTNISSVTPNVIKPAAGATSKASSGNTWTMKQGDTIAQMVRKANPNASEAELQGKIRQVLKDNDITEEQARNLPVGKKIDMTSALKSGETTAAKPAEQPAETKTEAKKEEPKATEESKTDKLADVPKPLMKQAEAPKKEAEKTEEKPEETPKAEETPKEAPKKEVEKVAAEPAKETEAEAKPEDKPIEVPVAETPVAEEPAVKQAKTKGEEPTVEIPLSEAPVVEELAEQPVAATGAEVPEAVAEDPVEELLNTPVKEILEDPTLATAIIEPLIDAVLEEIQQPEPVAPPVQPDPPAADPIAQLLNTPLEEALADPVVTSAIIEPLISAILNQGQSQDPLSAMLGTTNPVEMLLMSMLGGQAGGANPFQSSLGGLGGLGLGGGLLGGGLSSLGGGLGGNPLQQNMPGALKGLNGLVGLTGLSGGASGLGGGLGGLGGGLGSGLSALSPGNDPISQTLNFGAALMNSNAPAAAPAGFTQNPLFGGLMPDPFGGVGNLFPTGSTAAIPGNAFSALV